MPIQGNQWSLHGTPKDPPPAPLALADPEATDTVGDRDVEVLWPPALPLVLQAFENP